MTVVRAGDERRSQIVEWAAEESRSSIGVGAGEHDLPTVRRYRNAAAKDVALRQRDLEAGDLGRRGAEPEPDGERAHHDTGGDA